jgi:hypothetical protein
MSGQASVEVYRRENAILLPFGAVRQDAEGTYVLELGNAGKQTRHSVRTGVAGVNEVEIFGSLQPGMSVLLASPDLRPSSTATSPSPSASASRP